MSLGAGGARAGNYDFLARAGAGFEPCLIGSTAPRVRSAPVNMASRRAAVGVTLCYEPGQGAGPQGPSDYALVASSHEREGGVFRVDLRTGQMSICYVLNDKVVCTPPTK